MESTVYLDRFYQWIISQLCVWCVNNSPLHPFPKTLRLACIFLPACLYELNCPSVLDLIEMIMQNASGRGGGETVNYMVRPRVQDRLLSYTENINISYIMERRHVSITQTLNLCYKMLQFTFVHVFNNVQDVSCLVESLSSDGPHMISITHIDQCLFQLTREEVSIDQINGSTHCFLNRGIITIRMCFSIDWYKSIQLNIGIFFLTIFRIVSF